MRISVPPGGGRDGSSQEARGRITSSARPAVSASSRAGGVAGVAGVDVSLAEARARVTYDPAKSSPADFRRAVERAGYKAP